MKTIVEQQFKELKLKFPTAVLNNNIVEITDFKIPNGWNKNAVTVKFKIPSGFPAANPVDFYTDKDLQIVNRYGFVNPRNSNIYDEMLRMFWRVTKWSPNYDTLLTYVRVIQSRFNEVV